MSEQTLRWAITPLPCEMETQALLNCRELIKRCTGEEYTIDLLRSMPVSPTCGSLILIPTGMDSQRALNENLIQGILWVMKLDDQTVRILTILVAEKYRRKGYAAEAWQSFKRLAIDEGATAVTLEVRQENDVAFDFYSRRGLVALGRLSNYYRDTFGIVMQGTLKAEDA